MESRYKVRSVDTIFMGYRIYELPKRVWIYSIEGKEDSEIVDDIMGQICEELGDEVIGTEVETVINEWKIRNGYDG